MTTKTFTQAVKKRWVEALTSGKFEQGFGQLRDDDGRHCCLGVLNEIEQLGKPGHLGYVPHRFLDHKVQQELVILNDEGMPFDLIAGLIDEAL